MITEKRLKKQITIAAVTAAGILCSLGSHCNYGLYYPEQGAEK